MESSRIIAITGGIGAGKSVVASILRLAGFGVYDCDMRAKLPIVGEVASLNVSVAAGVFMYEALEQRRG